MDLGRKILGARSSDGRRSVRGVLPARRRVVRVFSATVPAERVFDPPWDLLGSEALFVTRQKQPPAQVGLTLAAEYLSEFRLNSDEGRVHRLPSSRAEERVTPRPLHRG